MSIILNGNEITPAQRIAALLWGTTQLGGSTDGLGLYENRLTNGSFEVNTAGWGANALNTIVRSNAVAAEVGAWSALGTYGNGNGGDTNVGSQSITLAAGTYTVSVWIYMPSSYSTPANNARPLVSIEGFAGISGTTSAQVANVTNTWQLITVTFTLSGTATGSIVMRTGFSPNQVANGNFFYFDGVMLEAGSVAHTYADHFGIAPGTGFGIWENGTNSFRHGQCGSIGGGSGADWNIISAGVTVPTLDATVPPPFSTQSVKVITDGTAASQAISPKSASGQAMGVGTIVATSIYFKGVAGASYTVQSRIVNTDATTTDATNMAITATGAWQLLVPNTVAVAAGKVGDGLAIRVGINGTRAETFWVAHPMLQKGVSTVSPYVATSGNSTATRNGSGPTALSKLITATQGWFAFYIIAGWAAASRTDFPELFEWQTDSANRIMILYNGSNSKWVMDSRIATIPVDANSAVQTFQLNSPVLVIGKWSSTNLGISVNGSAFTNVVNTKFLTPTGSTFNMGSASGPGAQIDSSIIWAACGMGTLSDADAATLNALGNTAPTFSTLPRAAQVTMIWPGISSTAADEVEFYYGTETGAGTDISTEKAIASSSQAGSGSDTSALKSVYAAADSAAGTTTGTLKARYVVGDSSQGDTESSLLASHSSSDDAHTSAGDIFDYGEHGFMLNGDSATGIDYVSYGKFSAFDVGRGIDYGDFFNVPGWVEQKAIVDTPTSMKVILATNIRLKVVGMADVGSEVVLQATFTDRSGQLVDPYVVKGSVKQPDGSAVNLNLARVSLGVYEATFVITQDGPHWWRAQGNGNVKAASEKSFQVPKEMVPAV